ncbi:sugar ABC transporter substrate-binding protein [Cohnella laeviribosi]|uniref:sugar ABC transporter substrate-binding protein n=1 Tax=Cohnella laeviribosi TaxID=380174 RepID=UPI003D1F6832
MKHSARYSVWAALALAIVLALTACGSKNGNTNAGSSPSASASASASASPAASGSEAPADIEALKGKKIALVMQFMQGTFSAQYVDGVKKQVAKYGGELKVFNANGDLNVMAANLDNAVNQKFDGILIDHGNAEALTAGVQKAVNAGIPVVEFDAGLSIEGVTSVAQNDQLLAQKTLEQLAKDAGDKGNIVKIWVAGFAPMERRQQAYDAFLNSHPDIKEVAAFGQFDNAQLNAQTQMEAVLRQYPEKGSITAVWAAWDEFAKGAATALKQAGRTEIKLYGIDLTDEDLAMIQDQDGAWVGSAAVDPSSIGVVQVRYLYQKLHGDKTDARVELEPVYVGRDALPKDKQITTAELSQYIPEWGQTETGNTEYLKQLEQSVGAQ